MKDKEKKALEDLSRLGGVPIGYFRCDFCQMSHPYEFIAGPMINFQKKKTYTVCSHCKTKFHLVEFESGFLGHGVDEDGHGYVNWDRIQINERPPTA